MSVMYLILYISIFLSVKETVAAYMDSKEVEVPPYVEGKFPENLQLSQIVETWKYAITTKQDWMMERWTGWVYRDLLGLSD